MSGIVPVKETFYHAKTYKHCINLVDNNLQIILDIFFGKKETHQNAYEYHMAVNILNHKLLQTCARICWINYHLCKALFCNTIYLKIYTNIFTHKQNRTCSTREYLKLYFKYPNQHYNPCHHDQILSLLTKSIAH